MWKPLHDPKRLKWKDAPYGHNNVSLVEEEKKKKKGFSTLPKFLSTHMTCTCGYMLRGCICLNAHSHAPAHKHQSIPCQLQSHLGQHSGWEMHVLYVAIMLLWRLKRNTVSESVASNLTGSQKQKRQKFTLKVIHLDPNMGLIFFCVIRHISFGQNSSQ